MRNETKYMPRPNAPQTYVKQKYKILFCKILFIAK